MSSNCTKKNKIVISKWFFMYVKCKAFSYLINNTLFSWGRKLKILIFLFLFTEVSYNMTNTVFPTITFKILFYRYISRLRFWSSVSRYHYQISLMAANNRSSQQICSIKIGVLKNFTKFTGKHLCQSLFF